MNETKHVPPLRVPNIFENLNLDEASELFTMSTIASNML